MHKVVSLALLGAVASLAGCRHQIHIKSVLLPNPQVVKDAKYFQSVVEGLPGYLKDEQNARFEQEEIGQVEDDLADIYAKADVESDGDFHKQVQKLAEDTGKLVAKDEFLEANRIG